jgi:hypothetical protein
VFSFVLLLGNAIAIVTFIYVLQCTLRTQLSLTIDRSICNLTHHSSQSGCGGGCGCARAFGARVISSHTRGHFAALRQHHSAAA